MNKELLKDARQAYRDTGGTAWPPGITAVVRLVLERAEKLARSHAEEYAKRGDEFSLASMIANDIHALGDET